MLINMINSLKLIMISILSLIVYSSVFQVVLGADLKDISIINLIATSEKYHDKTIRVIGYATLRFEGTAIYLSEESAKNGITTNAIWMSLGKDYSNYYKLNNKYVIIEGKFNANDHGHGGMFAGTIKDITRLEHWWVP